MCKNELYSGLVTIHLVHLCFQVCKFSPRVKSSKKKKYHSIAYFHGLDPTFVFFLFLYFIDKRVNILHVIPFYYWENNTDSSMLHLRQFLLIFLYFCQLVFKTTHKNKNIYKKNKTKTNKPKARASFCQWGKLR